MNKFNINPSIEFKPNAEERQEITDLSLHAMEQVLGVLDRTTALLPHPAAKVMLAEAITLAALTGQARKMRQLIEPGNPKADFQMYMKLALVRVHEGLEDFIEFQKSRGKGQSQGEAQGQRKS